MTSATATHVTVAFSPSDDATAAALRSERFRAYLRRAHAGAVAAGDEWAEFVSRGCGSTRDVNLRVEAVEGGERVGEGTAFAFEPR